MVVLQDADARKELEEQTGRTIDATILGDLGRSDVQALILYRQLGSGQHSAALALGRTYVGAVALLIPRAVWPDRVETKLPEGTETLYGRGTFRPGSWYSTKVYGLAGETMLNFGPLAVPLAFVVLGIAMGRLERFSKSLQPGDARQLLLPFLASVAVVALSADSDNLLFYIVNKGAVPTLVVLVGSRRVATGGGA